MLERKLSTEGILIYYNELASQLTARSTPASSLVTRTDGTARPFRSGVCGVRSSATSTILTIMRSQNIEVRGLTYFTKVPTDPSYPISRKPGHMIDINSPRPPPVPRLLRQHQNHDAATMGRVRPCPNGEERGRSICLVKQDFLIIEPQSGSVPTTFPIQH